MSDSEIITRRTVLVPLLQGAVWLASMTISVLCDFGNNVLDHDNVTRRLLAFALISLFFELLFTFIDMLFALSGFRISNDLRFKIQLRTISFLIFSVPMAVWAFISLNWIVIILMFGCLAGFKSGLMQAIAEIDNTKIPMFDIV